MNIAICDDENYWREELTLLLNEYKRVRRLEIYTTHFKNGISIFKSSKKFDVIFMDYQMDELDGIETARKLRMQNNNVIIIFVSAYPNVALDAFEVNAFRFIAKPINKSKLFRALDDYRKNAEQEHLLLFNTHDGTIKIKTNDIIYCEADKRHTVIHTTSGTYEIRTNIKEVENKLDNDHFFRCHKSYIVSFAHIKSHNNTDVFLDNNEKAYVSRNYLAAFKSNFQDYILRYNMRKI